MPKTRFLKEGQLIQCTQRESEVLILLAYGLSNKTIAAHLGLSPHTVRDHVSSLMQRHRLTGRVELVMRASSRPWQIGDDPQTYRLTKIPATETASQKSEWMLFS